MFAIQDGEPVDATLQLLEQKQAELEPAREMLKEIFGTFITMKKAALAKALMKALNIPTATAYRRLDEYERVGIINYNSLTKTYQMSQ